MSSAEETLAPWEYVSMALGITSQAWDQLGLGDDPAVAASSDLNVTVDRITSLLLIRIIAWLEPRGTFPDLATTTICRQLFVRRGDDKSEWPFPEVSVPIIQQLRQYVKVILTQYQENPYHNFEHCYHVTVSANKLLDLILNPNASDSSPRSLPYSYGFRDDSLMQFSQIFAALIHDVEHRGVPNRQLTVEDDTLALQYNDQSVAEMRSLTIAFSEFMKPDYGRLRNVLFPNIEDYRRFRAAVINLVLTTDLASPDRAQIGKSKWKEAFGDPYETVERKVMKQMERRASMASTGRRSIARPSRRMSAQSIMSELTLDSPVQMIETTAEELDDDESVSSTPDSSENEGDNGFTAPEPVVLDSSKLRTANLQSSDGTGPVFRPPKQGTTPMRKLRKKKGVTVDAPPLVSAMNSVAGQSADESVHSTASGNLAGMALKFHRRLSSIGPGSVANSAKRHRNTRLGLLRTVDLTGEALETYQKMEPRMSATGSTGGMEFADGVAGAKRVSVKQKPKEELDLLRESVVMETIMKAADVAHNLQSWEQMAKWSNKLFLELKRAYVQGRGDDPQGGWFSNQIGFLEAYLLPLARKLDDTGVFGDDDKGAMFASLVEENKERWMREGVSLTANIIREGHLQFPEADSDDEIEAYSQRTSAEAGRSTITPVQPSTVKEATLREVFNSNLQIQMCSRTSETTRAFKSSLRKYLKCALRIASQEWATLGFEPIECPSSSISAKYSATSIEVTSELATSLLLVRLLALRLSDENFKSYTTAEVCNTILYSSQVFEKAMVAVNHKAFTELRSFCRAIFHGYNEVPYHNYLHAYHVLISSNKLLDIVLQGGDPEKVSKNNTEITDLPFESHPLLHWSLLFGALIHDVDHLGVPNKQLVNENHPLAIQYNDQSVAEQRSLTVAFAELLNSDYDNLRQAMFPSGICQSSEYRKFRESVTSLILVTDISEPERGASVRQRWEKVFKDTETQHHASGKFADEMGSSAPKLTPPREHPTPRRPSKAVCTTTVSPKASKPKLTLRGNTEVEDRWVEFGLTPSTHFPRNCGSSMHDTLGFWWFSPEAPDDDSCESDSINSFSEEDSIYSDISKEFVSHMEVTRTPAEESEDSIQIFLSDDYPSVNLQDSCASFGSSNHCLLSPTPGRTMSGGARSNSSSFSRLHRSTKSISKVSPTNSGTSHATSGKPYADLSDSFPNHASRSSVFSSLSRGSSKRHDGSHIRPHGGKVNADVNKDHRGKSALRPLVSENSMVTVTTVDATTCSSFAKFDFSECEFEESERELNTELDGKKPMDSVTADTTKIETVGVVDHATRSMSLMEHILLVSDVSHGMQSWDNMIKFSHRLSKEIRRSIMDGRSGGFSEDPLNDWYENQSAFLNGYMIPLAQRIERTQTLPCSSEHGESDRGFLTKHIHKNLDRWQEDGHEVIALWRRERDATEHHAERPARTSSRRKNSTKSPGKAGSDKRKSLRSHKSRASVS